MACHMLGKRLLLFLLHHGLGVFLVDDDLQALAALRAAAPLAGKPVGCGNPGGKVVFVSCHFDLPTSLASYPRRDRTGGDAAETFPHNAASSRRSAWPTSGRRPPCERGHPCGDRAEILRTTHSSAST